MKKCSKCGIEKPIEAFSKMSKSKDGLQSQCKDCMRVYRAANRDRIAQRKREYYDANRDRILEQAREYYSANREQRLEYNRAYHEANRDRRREYTREWREKNLEHRRAYYEANRDQILEQNRVWRQDNHDRRAEYHRAWRQDNRDKCRSYTHARRARKVNMYGGTPDHKRIAEHMKLLSQDPCLWCGETEGEFHWDHIVPLNNYGSHEWWNLARSCAPCNLKKSDRIPFGVGIL